MKKTEVAATIKKLAVCRVARASPRHRRSNLKVVYDVAKEI